MTSTDSILLAALGLALFILWRLGLGQRVLESSSSPPPAGAVTPGGTVFLALGQNAVAPDRQWLVLQPGQ